MPTVSETFHAVGIDEERSEYNTATNLQNLIGQSVTSTSYAQFGLLPGSNVETFIFVTFDFSSIPANATIDAFTAKIKIAGTGSANYVTNRQVRAFNGDTTKGYSSTYSTSAATLTLDTGSTPTREQLDNITLRLRAQRRTSNTSTAYYIRPYGVDISITYTYEDTPQNTIYVKRSGVWMPVSKAYKKENGTWVEQTDLASVFVSGKKYRAGN